MAHVLFRLAPGCNIVAAHFPTNQCTLCSLLTVPQVDWQYIIIDEAQRMKDRQSKLAKDLEKFKSEALCVVDVFVTKDLQAHLEKFTSEGVLVDVA